MPCTNCAYFIFALGTTLSERFMFFKIVLTGKRKKNAKIYLKGKIHLFHETRFHARAQTCIPCVTFYKICSIKPTILRGNRTSEITLPQYKIGTVS